MFMDTVYSINEFIYLDYLVRNAYTPVQKSS